MSRTRRITGWILKSVVIMLVLAALIYLCIGLDCSLRVTSYSITSDKVSVPLRLALVSDLHSRMYGEGQRQIVEYIDEINPDAVLLAGDIYDKYMSNDGALALMDALGGKYPCYYVTGNHEHMRDQDIGELLKEVTDRGIINTDLCWSELEIKGQRVIFYGVNDRIWPSNSLYLKSLQDAFANLDKTDAYVVFLIHRSERWDIFTQMDFDLVVSGHAHGGQMAFPPFIDALYSPDQGLFPKLISGVHTYDSGTVQVISRGMANTAFVPRLYNPCEIVEINIIPQ